MGEGLELVISAIFKKSRIEEILLKHLRRSMPITVFQSLKKYVEA